MQALAERNATPSPVLCDTTKQQPKLLDVVRERMRVKHYSLRTEQTYLYWIRWFIRHNDRRHPRDMGAPEVEAFLSMLANERNVAASTWCSP